MAISINIYQFVNLEDLHNICLDRENGVNNFMRSVKTANNCFVFFKVGPRST